MIRLMPGGVIAAWKSRAEAKSRIWGVWGGGYLKASKLGVRILQRFAEWGTAANGEQKELIARFELELRQVKTAGWIHLELVNPFEARLLMLNFKVWKGWNAFLTVNLGARFTKASQVVQAHKMSQMMAEKAKREQAERIQVRRMAAQVQRQRGGRPWPARAR